MLLSIQIQITSHTCGACGSSFTGSFFNSVVTLSNLFPSLTLKVLCVFLTLIIPFLSSVPPLFSSLSVCLPSVCESCFELSLYFSSGFLKYSPFNLGYSSTFSPKAFIKLVAVEFSFFSRLVVLGSGECYFYFVASSKRRKLWPVWFNLYRLESS
jgi:hypothetical protein